MSGWNGFDFIIFLIFAVNTIMGLSRGATKEIISMMCLCAALIVTIKFTVPLAAFFNRSPLITNVVSNEYMQNFMQAIGAGPITKDLLMQLFYAISMLLCFTFTFSLCEGALSYSSYVQNLSLTSTAISAKLGAVLGCTRGYIVSLLFICIFTLHIFQGQGNFITGSYFARLFQPAAIRLDALISGQNPDQYMKAFEGKELYNADKVLEQLGAPNGVPSQRIVPQGQQPQPNQQQQPQYYQPQFQQQQQPSSQPSPAQPNYYQ